MKYIKHTIFRCKKENPRPCVLLFKKGSNLSEHHRIDTTPEISRRGDLQDSGFLQQPESERALKSGEGIQ